MCVPAVREANLAGGVYIGVGPDQNFSLHRAGQAVDAPSSVDNLRRDNLLLHLLFKALFSLVLGKIRIL